MLMVVCGDTTILLEGTFFASNPERIDFATLDGCVLRMTWDSVSQRLFVAHGADATVVRPVTGIVWNIVSELERPKLPYTALGFQPSGSAPVGIYSSGRRDRVLVMDKDYGVGYLFKPESLSPAKYSLSCYDISDLQGVLCWQFSSGNRMYAFSFKESLELTMLASGMCDMSRDKSLMAAWNLNNGLDIYKFTQSKRELDRTISLGENLGENQNVILDVVFIHEDHDVLLGSNVGKPLIVNVRSHQIVQKLAHSPVNDIVPVAAYARCGNRRYIATADRELGSETKLRVGRIVVLLDRLVLRGGFSSNNVFIVRSVEAVVTFADAVKQWGSAYTGATAATAADGTVPSVAPSVATVATVGNASPAKCYPCRTPLQVQKDAVSLVFQLDQESTMMLLLEDDPRSIRHQRICYSIDEGKNTIAIAEAPDAPRQELRNARMGPEYPSEREVAAPGFFTSETALTAIPVLSGPWKNGAATYWTTEASGDLISPPPPTAVQASGNVLVHTNTNQTIRNARRKVWVLNSDRVWEEVPAVALDGNVNGEGFAHPLTPNKCLKLARKSGKPNWVTWDTKRRQSDPIPTGLREAPIQGQAEPNQSYDPCGFCPHPYHQMLFYIENSTNRLPLPILISATTSDILRAVLNAAQTFYDTIVKHIALVLLLLLVVSNLTRLYHWIWPVASRFLVTLITVFSFIFVESLVWVARHLLVSVSRLGALGRWLASTVLMPAWTAVATSVLSYWLPDATYSTFSPKYRAALRLRTRVYGELVKIHHSAEAVLAMDEGELLKLAQAYTLPGEFIFENRERSNDWRRRFKTLLQPTVDSFMDEMAEILAERFHTQLPALYEDGLTRFDTEIALTISHTMILTELEPLLNALINQLQHRWAERGVPTDAAAVQDWIQTNLSPQLKALGEGIELPIARARLKEENTPLSLKTEAAAPSPAPSVVASNPSTTSSPNASTMQSPVTPLRPKSILSPPSSTTAAQDLKSKQKAVSESPTRQVSFSASTMTESEDVESVSDTGSHYQHRQAVLPIKSQSFELYDPLPEQRVFSLEHVTTMQDARALVRSIQALQVPLPIEELRIDLKRPLSSQPTLVALFRLLYDASPAILVFNIHLSSYAWAPRIPNMPRLVHLQTTVSHAQLARFLRDRSAAPHLADLYVGACGQAASLCFPRARVPGVIRSPIPPLDLLNLQLKFPLRGMPRVLSSVQRLLLLNELNSLKMIDLAPSIQPSAHPVLPWQDTLSWHHELALMARVRTIDICTSTSDFPIPRLAIWAADWMHYETGERNSIEVLYFECENYFKAYRWDRSLKTIFRIGPATLPDREAQNTRIYAHVCSVFYSVNVIDRAITLGESPIFASAVIGIISFHALLIASVAWSGVFDMIGLRRSTSHLTNMWLLVLVCISIYLPEKSMPGLSIVLVSLCNASATAWSSPERPTLILVSPVVFTIYAVHILHLLVARAVMTSRTLNLCEGLEGGLCDEAFRRTLRRTINYSLGIAAMSFGQDVMSGAIRLYPRTLTPHVRRYQAPYAIMVLGAFTHVYASVMQEACISLVGALYETLLALEIAIPVAPALPFFSVQSISHAFSCIAGLAVVHHTVLSSAIREGPYLPEALIFLLLLALLVISLCGWADYSAIVENEGICYREAMPVFIATVGGAGTSLVVSAALDHMGRQLHFHEKVLIGMGLITFPAPFLSFEMFEGLRNLRIEESFALLTFSLVLFACKVLRGVYCGRWGKGSYYFIWLLALWPLSYIMMFCLMARREDRAKEQVLHNRAFYVEHGWFFD
ncbi:hypothetical protein BDZ89DRAFT_1048195 [Hymenopellis radicata]|nr:hypothetical protein BDZ89DRAFT_1048195 [Hymenopellis radicata]